ncbi:hypothetical protein BGW41_004470, partial [Actinomortierella wolfii]
EFSQLVAQVNQLNRNLETIMAIGQNFEQLTQLWKNFHTSPIQEQQQRQQQELEQLEDVGSDDAAATESHDE